jgi:hypothetical protein
MFAIKSLLPKEDSYVIIIPEKGKKSNPRKIFPHSGNKFWIFASKEIKNNRRNRL